MEKVSIIIPVYNRARQVQTAINAALKQTYKNVETIVVDDGSTDDTLSVLTEYARKYSSIKLVSQKNQGVVKARQAGLKIATGEFVIFLDSDDIINACYVEELLKAQKTNNATITLARRAQIMNDIVTIRYQGWPVNFNVNQNPKYLPTIWVGLTCKMFKKSELFIPDYGLIANEDLAFIYYFLAKTEEIACSNKSLYTTGISVNSLARDFIYGDLNYIENTIRPLDIEYQLFMENGLFDKYYSELEAIFIKNIVERVVNIKLMKIPVDKKKVLIGILTDYLTNNFSNWRNNKYFKKFFFGFSYDTIFYGVLSSGSMQCSEIPINLNGLSTIEAFKMVLKTEEVSNDKNLEAVKIFNRILKKK